MYVQYVHSRYFTNYVLPTVVPLLLYNESVSTAVLSDCVRILKLVYFNSCDELVCASAGADANGRSMIRKHPANLDIYPIRLYYTLPLPRNPFSKNKKSKHF